MVSSCLCSASTTQNARSPRAPAGPSSSCSTVARRMPLTGAIESCVTVAFMCARKGRTRPNPVQEGTSEMSEQTKSDAKLVQFLNDAYSTERRLEVTLRGTDRGDDPRRLPRAARAAPQGDALAREGRRAPYRSARRRRRAGARAGRAEPRGRGRAGRLCSARPPPSGEPLDAVLGTGAQERMLKNAADRLRRRGQGDRDLSRDRRRSQPRSATRTPPSSRARSCARRSACRTSSAA